MLTDEERTQRQRESRRRYDSKTKQYVMRLRRGADADVIERLDSMPHKTEYLRRLIRNDITDEILG